MLAVRFECWLSAAIVVLLGVTSLRAADAPPPAAAAKPTANAAATPPAAPATIDFTTHIAPIFKKYCLGCHNAKDAEGKLVLESYEGLLKGGKGGAVVIASASDRSRMLLMLDGRATPKMPPPDNDAPSAAEIASIKAWIDAGAKSPSGKAPDPTALVSPSIPLLAPARQPVSAVAIAPDGKLAAVGGYRSVRLISVENRATRGVLEGIRGPITRLAFTRDGARLLAAAGEPGVFGEATLWSVAERKLLRTFTGHRDSLYAAAINGDGSLIATAGYDQEIKLWKTADGAEVRTLTGHNGAVYDLAFNAAVNISASASANRTVKPWDVASGARLDTLSQSLKEVYAVQFTPDGKQVVSGGVDNRIRVWQLSPTAKENTNPITVTRFAHEGAVLRLAFSPNGKTLVTSAEDRTVKVWDATNYTERLALETQSDWPTALAIGPDNKTVLVGRLDGTLAFYDATSGAPIAPAKPELAACQPRGILRGVPAKVRLTGKNLIGASAVALNHAQLTAKVVPGDASKPDELWVEVASTAAVPRGSYTLTVTTPGGMSNAVPIEVDNLPQLVEQEPNSGASAQHITLPAVVWGTVTERGDSDEFAFDAHKGQHLVFDLGTAFLASKLNGVLTVLSPTGEVLASRNDFDGQTEPFLDFKVPADGRYTVRVSDQLLTGSPQHTYRLIAGELPYAIGVYPPTVAANAEADVEFVGYNLPAKAHAHLKAGAAGDAPVPVDGEQLRSRGALKVRVASVADVLEAEPNDDPAHASPLAAPGVASGRISAAKGEDVDLYRFHSAAGQSWVVETEAARLGSPIDTRIEVLNSQGQPVERVIMQAVLDAYIDFRGIDSDQAGLRPKPFAEMDLNQYMYIAGEVCRVFRMPQGPDSDLLLYTLGGKRHCYFDTSATSHALDTNVYIVRPLPPGAKPVPNGLPLFPIYYANDDDGERKLSRDSKLTFTAPADGDYLVRVRDVRGLGGDRYSYRLHVRAPEPGFDVRIVDGNPTVNAGSGRRLTLAADRHDNFDGPITVEFAGLPPGLTASGPVVIEAGQVEARVVLAAASNAAPLTPESLKNVKVSAHSEIGGKLVAKDVPGLGQIKLEAKPNLVVRLEPAEVAIAPGTTVTATLKIERNGFNDLVNFDVDNLPFGVIVDNIGLNGVLIPAGQSERQIFLTAAKGIPESKRAFYAVATNAGAQASSAISLKVVTAAGAVAAAPAKEAETKVAPAK